MARKTSHGVFLTAEMIATRLGISRRTLYRWINAGDFPGPAPIAGGIYWTEDDWQDYLRLGWRWRPRKLEEQLKAPPDDEEEADEEEEKKAHGAEKKKKSED